MPRGSSHTFSVVNCYKLKSLRKVEGSYLHVITEASIRLHERSTSELRWAESCWTADTSIVLELCLTAVSTLIFCARENVFLISCNVTGNFSSFNFMHNLNTLFCAWIEANILVIISINWIDFNENRQKVFHNQNLQIHCLRNQ